MAGLAVFVVVTLAGSLGVWTLAPGSVIKALGAQPCDEADHPRLYNLVDGLCAIMGLPAPAIVIVESPLPNAMALGRDPDAAVLVVTTGLDAVLSLVELEGVLAHELVHIKRHDTVVSAPAVVIGVFLSLVVGTARATDTVHRLVGPGTGVRRRPAGGSDRAVPARPRGSPRGHDRHPRWAGLAARPGPDSAAHPLAVDRLPAHRRDGRTQGGTGEVGNLDDTGVRSAALALR